jgi:hypothetical protein
MALLKGINQPDVYFNLPANYISLANLLSFPPFEVLLIAWQVPNNRKSKENPAPNRALSHKGLESPDPNIQWRTPPAIGNISSRDYEVDYLVSSR